MRYLDLEGHRILFGLLAKPYMSNALQGREGGMERTSERERERDRERQRERESEKKLYRNSVSLHIYEYRQMQMLRVLYSIPDSYRAHAAFAHKLAGRA